MPAAFSFVVSQIRLGDVVLGAALALLGCALATAILRYRLPGAHPRLCRVTQFSWQLGALLGLEQAYEITRARIPHETDLALMNAYRVLDLEWRYGFFIEERLERFFLHYQLVMNAVYAIYGLGHVGVTVGVLALIYIRRRDRFPFVRGLIMATTGITLIVYYLYPTAPPRMLPQYGFVDPLVLHHFIASGGEQTGSYMYNPYAAMPSLHVGYALVVAWALLLSYRSPTVRVLAVLYPIVMAASVIITANHWLLDVAGAVLTVGLAGCLTWSGGLALERARRVGVKIMSSHRQAVGLAP